MMMTLIIVINAKLLNFSNRVIHIISLERRFFKFYRRHHKLVSKFNAGLKFTLHQGQSKPEFYDTDKSKKYAKIRN